MICLSFSSIGILNKQEDATTEPIIKKAIPKPNSSIRNPADIEPMNIPSVSAVLKTPIVDPIPNS